jgi:hypothetical protein
MTNQPKTGKVKAESIKARSVVTGIDVSGADDATIQTALELMKTLQTGDVIAEGGIELSGDLVTGLSAPKDRQEFMVQARALRQQLVTLAAEPGIPERAALEGAVASIEEVVIETGKTEPLRRRVINRLRETIEFIGDAGKTIDAAHKAGPLILQAVGTATVLYQAAQVLF